MTQVILFDNETRDHLLPLTYTRPVADLRVGILTIREKWERALGFPTGFITQDYLAQRFSLEVGDENFFINGSVLPSDKLCALIRQMDFNEAYLQGDELIVAKLDRKQLQKLINDEEIDELKGHDIEDTPFLKINRPSDLVRLNGEALREDFQVLKAGRRSMPLPASNRLIGPADQLFIEPGATLEGVSLNTTTGPIYIGRQAEIMEGSMLRGPIALLDHAVVRMGARIYGPTTIGPQCKVGGEVVQSILWGHSNKAHDGFLGHSVLGEWCNLGSGTEVSNLKNSYEEVKLWNYPAGRFLPTGEQFLGVIMGDHAKTGVNVTLNTGTVIGVATQVFGPGFPRNFIPSYAFGGAHGFQTFMPEKALATAARVMDRRQVTLTIEDRIILLRIFEDSAKFRNWEKKK
ncbi:MAG: glucose-1-phosphate thymidylyltransferase [Lewinellaceae bacterium]|nr:glucose-1-phosphate thymidylyltransferase [Lewinellaceae bacterium]